MRPCEKKILLMFVVGRYKDFLKVNDRFFCYKNYKFSSNSKNINHQSPMLTEKSKPSGQRIMPETSFPPLSIYPWVGISTSFPELSVDPRVGFSRSASETDDKICLSKNRNSVSYVIFRLYRI